MSQLAGLLNSAVQQGASVEDILALVDNNPIRDQVVPGPTPIQGRPDVPLGQEFGDITSIQGPLIDKYSQGLLDPSGITTPASPSLWDRITAPAPPGTVAGQPTSEAGLMEGHRNWQAAAAANLENHPIYGNSFMSENGGADFIEGFADDPVVNTVQGMIGQEPAEAQSNEDRVLQEVVVQAQKREAQGGEATNVKKALEDPEVSVADVTLANSKDLASGTAKAVKSQGGWTEGWQKAWDNFSETVDLTTLGLSLMMNSGNGQSLTENLGIAISQGMAAREAQYDKDVASARLDSKEAREERETAVKEANAQTNAARAEAMAEYNNAMIDIHKYDSYTKRSNAAANLLRAKSASNGWEHQKSNPSAEAAVQKAAGMLDLDISKDDQDVFNKNAGSAYWTLVHNNPGAPQSQLDQWAREAAMYEFRHMKGPGWFSGASYQ